MRILPVIDLMGGQVVHGIAGNRGRYRPIQSRLAKDSSPAKVGEAFLGLGLKECYLADLDAIGGGVANLAVIDELTSLGISLWIDAGLANVEMFRSLSRAVSHQHTLIVCTESLENLVDLRPMIELVGSERMAFSLDLRNGLPVTKRPFEESSSDEELAGFALSVGITRLIVLDMAAVGTSGGVPTLPLCQKIKNDWPRVELITGGGVSSSQDLAAVADAGCDAALVASALHDTRIGAAELGKWRNG